MKWYCVTVCLFSVFYYSPVTGHCTGVRHRFYLDFARKTDQADFTDYLMEDINPNKEALNVNTYPIGIYLRKVII